LQHGTIVHPKKQLGDMQPVVWVDADKMGIEGRVEYTSGLCHAYVRYWRQLGQDMLSLSSSAFDPFETSHFSPGACRWWRRSELPSYRKTDSTPYCLPGGAMSDRLAKPPRKRHF